MPEIIAVLLKLLVIAAFGAAAALLGSPVVSWFFERVDARDAEDSPAETPRVQAAAQTLRGGRWIGILERIAIYAALLSGFAEGVAIVLAVKSLARYPELRATSSGAAERFIIGTFTSSLFAASCAGLAWSVIHLW